MPPPWRYERILAQYVPEASTPAPRPTTPRPRGLARADWLKREKRLAREHVQRRLALSVERGFIPPVNVPRALAILERAIGGDIEESIDRRREQYGWVERLARAADALIERCVAIEGDAEGGAPQLVFGARKLDEVEIDEAWRAIDPSTRASLPSVRAWRAVRHLVEDHALDEQLRKVALLERTAALSDAANALLDAWDVPPDPRRVSFMHAVRCADPIGERFASECLAHGLRPVEAAMIEALVATTKSEPASPRGAPWFDEPDRALRRWREAYERLFNRCGIGPDARRRSTLAARDQSG